MQVHSFRPSFATKKVFRSSYSQHGNVPPLSFKQAQSLVSKLKQEYPWLTNEPDIVPVSFHNKSIQDVFDFFTDSPHYKISSDQINQIIRAVIQEGL